MQYVDDGHIKYLEDDDGTLHFIVDRRVKKRIKKEEDWRYRKWEEYNTNRVLKGYEPIECYEEFLVNVLDIVLSCDEELILEEYRKQKSYAKYMGSKSEIDTLIRDNLGAFYFSIYSRLLKVDLEPQFRFRFIYLCTYLNYNNKLIYGNTKEGNNLMLESDLEEVLRLSKREMIYTKKALIKANLITIEEDKTISVNRKYALRGKIGKRDLKKGSIRIMMEGIQKLYESVSVREHKRLSLFIEILPYINYNFNIVCSNPNEMEQNKIKPLTLKELCRIVGYDESNSNKLKKELLKLKIDGKNVVMISLIDNKHCISINPKVYYKGNNIKALQYLIGIFEIFE